MALGQRAPHEGNKVHLLCDFLHQHVFLRIKGLQCNRWNQKSNPKVSSFYNNLEMAKSFQCMRSHSEGMILKSDKFNFIKSQRFLINHKYGQKINWEKICCRHCSRHWRPSSRLARQNLLRWWILIFQRWLFFFLLGEWSRPYPRPRAAGSIVTEKQDNAGKECAIK